MHVIQNKPIHLSFTLFLCCYEMEYLHLQGFNNLANKKNYFCSKDTTFTST